MLRGVPAIYRLALILALVSLTGWAASPGPCLASGKQVVETKYTLMTFNSTADLERFNRSIRYADRGTLAGIFSSSSGESPERELARKVDLLFEKVQQILDMRKEMRKVRVLVVSNKAELDRAYSKIFGGTNSVRGWYVFELNTVFLNAEDVHEGMLAHELGHAVIDHYFGVRPPRATAEILAKYVDKNLFEEVKRY